MPRLSSVPHTEGIKYAGSKRRLLARILDLIAPLRITSVLDGFAGTTRVAQALSQAGYRVVCNDIADWSRVFGCCYLLNRRPVAHYQPLIDHLNALPGVDGWFTAHYGGAVNDGCSIQADSKKRLWQLHNTRKLDALRTAIDRLTADPIERSVLLTSLILALDRVDNTVGHYASYLREWAPRSYRPLHLEVPHCPPSAHAHEVHQADIFQTLRHCTADLAYYDPPYGSANDKMPPSRIRYASYYHIWTTICRNDRPELIGAANRRRDASDVCAASAFEEFRRDADGRYRVLATIDRLLGAMRTRYIVLSYGTGGRLTLAEVAGLLHERRLDYRLLAIDQQRNVMASMRWTNAWVRAEERRNQEYLFLIATDGKLDV